MEARVSAARAIIALALSIDTARIRISSSNIDYPPWSNKGAEVTAARAIIALVLGIDTARIRISSSNIDYRPWSNSSTY